MRSFRIKRILKICFKVTNYESFYQKALKYSKTGISKKYYQTKNDKWIQKENFIYFERTIQILRRVSFIKFVAEQKDRKKLRTRPLKTQQQLCKNKAEDKERPCQKK